MSLTPFSALLAALVLLQRAAPLPSSSWIADLKASRSTLGTKEVRVAGDVVDIRSTSPTARFGFYRLIDASDPTGLLVRTNELPKNGGSLRIRARVAEQQPPDGSLLLEELERAPLNRKPVIALILGALSLAGVITLATLLVRAVSEERRYKVTPPLWLLPDAGPYGKAATGAGPANPPLKYAPELEEQDRKTRERLSKRRRKLLQMMLGSLSVTAACGAWLLLSRPAAAQVPTFIFIEANDVPLPAPDTVLAFGPLPGSDSGGIGMPPFFRDTLFSPQPPAQGPRQRDTARIDPRPQSQPPVFVAETVRVVLPTPPPPPPTSTPDSVPAARDPEMERIHAADALGAAAASLIQAINAKRAVEVAQLVPEGMAGNLGRRDNFMKLVRDLQPRVVLMGIDPVSLTEDGAEARFTVTFSWRGEFGVERRKNGRFLGVVRRDGTGWHFQGAQLLDAVP